VARKWGDSSAGSHRLKSYTKTPREEQKENRTPRTSQGRLLEGPYMHRLDVSRLKVSQKGGGDVSPGNTKRGTAP